MKTLTSILRWLASMWREILVTLFVVALVIKIAPMLRVFDDTAAALDPGVISFIALGLFALFAAVVAFFLVWRLALPKRFDEWVDDEDPVGTRPSLRRDWDDATPGVRLSCFFGLIVAVIAAVAAVAVAAF